MSSRQLDDLLGKLLYHAFDEARKRKLSTSNEHRFELAAPENLTQLKSDILTRRYSPSRGIAFVNEEPVLREIFAAPFRDRIVHHLIILLTGEWWDNRFIYDSYSCRKNKGNDFGIRRLYHHIRAVSNNFQTETYVYKFDIQSYFTSLPRKLLFDRAIWGLRRQFLYEGHTSLDRELYHLLYFLWEQIIFDNPIENVTIRGSRALWERLPASKSLFYQRAGTGIVIGNLTSQVLSNVFLDPLDRFITQKLGYRHYGRYVDDFFVVIPAAELEHFKDKIVPLINSYIAGLGLTLHPRKCKSINIEKGIPFLGARIYPYRILPDYRLVKNYKRAVRLIAAGEKDPSCLVSYMGRMQHFDSQHIQQKIWASVGWDYKLGKDGCPNSRFYTDFKAYQQEQERRRRCGTAGTQDHRA